MIDWARVTELRDEIGPDDFDEVSELFLLEVEDALSRLEDAMNDPPQMQELLHFLKGSALNLGFREMSAMCSAGEADAAQGRVTVDPIELKAVYRSSRKVFETEFAQRFAA
jgi:HPt (histidine-containing phosphotransfer) domain-containing protein